MKSSYPEDPLRNLGKKALRRLAQQYKIKHFYRKSPAALRRAIRRAQEREQQLLEAGAKPGQTPKANLKPLSPEELADRKRREELKAYEEHRLRYLFMPSRFVHKGTHEEFLLEKDEDIELPDFYQQDELVAMPVDPHRFYVYWDFAEETLYDVRSWLAEDAPFLLRIHDVTAIVFNGSNALASWDATCHPLVREWYLNAPVNGRNLIVELGVVLPGGFRPVLRSNPMFVPPAGVATVTSDVFAHFVPGQPRETDQQLKPVTSEADLPHRPETSAHVFFQEYVPTPVRFHPAPPPKQVLTRTLDMPAALPVLQVNTPEPPAAPVFPAAELADSHDRHQEHHETRRETRIVASEPIPVRVPIEQPAPSPVPIRMEPVSGSAEWTEQDVLRYLSEGGSVTLQEWLGLPHAIRWLSDMPIGMSPVFFQSWLTDPYDQAMMISYSIWPWELTEYLPLGASDEILRRFLGASLFSWFTPGGSERMGWWQGPSGASEGIRWLQPMGASELSWSGSVQPGEKPGRSAWTLWPAPVSGRGLNDSGSGLFGGESGSGLFGTLLGQKG